MKKLGLAIIGCGHITEIMHAPSLLELADRYDIRALCDTDPQKLEKIRGILTKGGVYDRALLTERAYSDYTDILKLKDIDAVLLATPNFHHEEAAIAIMRAGKHLFCEKPVALTVAGHERVQKVIAETKRVFQAGLVFRYSPFFHELSRQIQKKEIGNLQQMYLHEFRHYPPVGWRYELALAGEVFLEKNCHHFDIFNWLVGENVEPKKVVAFGGQNVLKSDKKKVFLRQGEEAEIVGSETLDNHFCIVEYKNGVRCSMGLSFFAPHGNELKLGLIGDLGKIDAWEHEQKITTWTKDRKYSGIIPQGAEGSEWQKGANVENYFTHSGSIEQWQSFHADVLAEREPFCNIKRAIASARVALAAELSLKENRIVTFG